jgi:hypothetical protein
VSHVALPTKTSKPAQKFAAAFNQYRPFVVTLYQPTRVHAQNDSLASVYLKRARQLLAAADAMPGAFRDPGGAYTSSVSVRQGHDVHEASYLHASPIA